MDPSDVPKDVVEDLGVTTTATRPPIVFITANQLTTDERMLVPEPWLESLDCSGRDGVSRMLDEWERVLPGRLPRTTARIRGAGTDVILGRQRGAPVLIYLLSGQFGRRRYCPWIATPPQPIFTVPERLQRLPSDILAFHTQLHDEIESPRAGGLLPITHMDPVGEYYDADRPFEMYPSVESWSSGPRLPAPTEQPDWSDVVLVHYDGGPGRLCAVLGDVPETTRGWYWFEGSMSPERNLWEALDASLEHGATEWRAADD